MYFLYRWWDRYRALMAVALLSLSVAWLIRQTGSASLLEIYRLISLPFQPNLTQQQELIDARTWELQQQVMELKTQNQQLRGLVGQTAIAQSQAIGAPVIGHSADHWWQQITLGRGSRSGVKIGAVVMAPGGLVGRVTLVTDHTSRVLLITDPTSRIGVTINRSRAMGILRGETGKQATIEFFEKDPNVRPGDVIVTSTLSSLFPAGLAVGRIQTLNLTQTSTPQAIVDLAVPIGNVEWVTIYLDAKTSKSMVSAGT